MKYLCTLSWKFIHFFRVKTCDTFRKSVKSRYAISSSCRNTADSRSCSWAGGLTLKDFADMQKMQKMQSTCTGKTPNNSLQHNDLQRQKMQKCITDLLVRVHFCSLYIYIIPIYILYIYNKYNPVKPRKIKQIQGKVISAFLHFPSCRPSRNFYTPPSGHTQRPNNP